MEEFQGTSTQQPERAALRVVRARKRRELTDDEWAELAQDLWQTWDAANSARGAYNENLEAWNALYEMESDEIDFPWPGAANLIVPIVPAELDQLKAAISNQVLGVQRLVVVTPGDNDPETAQLSPHLEKWLNGEQRRIRTDGESLVSKYDQILHVGLRDGAAPCDVLFTEHVEPKLIITDEVATDTDEATGETTVRLDDDQMPVHEQFVQRVDETISEATVEPYLLKEALLLPDESTSLYAALGLTRTLWMTEKQMRAMVKSDRNPNGPFRMEKVQEVLSWRPTGESDVSSDPNRNYDKTAGGQINVGAGQGTLVSRFFRNRGPFEIIRIFSDQFNPEEPDNPDAPAIPCIFWIYAQQPSLMLGWCEFEYATGAWPTFLYSPMKRPLRPYGYSLCERLADLTADTSAGRNQRRNYIDMSLMPVLLQRSGDFVDDRNRMFMPGVRWDVEDPQASLKWFIPPPLSSDSFADEARTDVYVNRLTGQGDPQLGAPSSGRRSATESRQRAMANQTRNADMAKNFREFLCAVINYYWKLTVQYLGAAQEGPTTQVSPELASAYGDKQTGGYAMQLDPRVFRHKFNISIAGLSDPTDVGTLRAELMGAIDVSAKAFPWILQDPEKAYALAQRFWDTFNWANSEMITGTAEEAQQRKQAMAQAAAQQAAAAGGQPGAVGGSPAALPQGAPPNAPQ